MGGFLIDVSPFSFLGVFPGEPWESFRGWAFRWNFLDEKPHGKLLLLHKLHGKSLVDLRIVVGLGILFMVALDIQTKISPAKFIAHGIFRRKFDPPQIGLLVERNSINTTHRCFRYRGGNHICLLLTVFRSPATFKKQKFIPPIFRRISFFLNYHKWGQGNSWQEESDAIDVLISTLVSQHVSKFASQYIWEPPAEKLDWINFALIIKWYITR